MVGRHEMIIFEVVPATNPAPFGQKEISIKSCTGSISIYLIPKGLTITTPMGLEPTVFATGKQRLTIRPRSPDVIGHLFDALETCIGENSLLIHDIKYQITWIARAEVQQHSDGAQDSDQPIHSMDSVC